MNSGICHMQEFPTPFPWCSGSSETHPLVDKCVKTWESLWVALTCMLFQAASPRPRIQVSSLSGEPKVPCLVSVHSPVPTL